MGIPIGDGPRDRSKVTPALDLAGLEGQLTAIAVAKEVYARRAEALLTGLGKLMTSAGMCVSAGEVYCENKDVHAYYRLSQEFGGRRVVLNVQAYPGLSDDDHVMLGIRLLDAASFEAGQDDWRAAWLTQGNAHLTAGIGVGTQANVPWSDEQTLAKVRELYAAWAAKA